MFLVQYAKGHYINAETLQWVSFKCGQVKFGVVGDPGAEWSVDADFTDTFINHLGSLDDNICAQQAGYNRIHT